MKTLKKPPFSLLSAQSTSQDVSNNFSWHRSMESGAPKTTIHSRLLQGEQDKTSLGVLADRAKKTCENCRPWTPITCVTRCDIWKMKNELRRLLEKMGNPSFMRDLLNTLKNKRRLQILEILSGGRYSISRLQQELKKFDYFHSKGTMTEEYINPLVDIGLVKENNNKYHTTIFGVEFNELIKDFSDFRELLPVHSECYEEKMILELSESPKTYEELKSVVPVESLSRVLKRLQETNLIAKSNENSYIFYFRTRRKPDQEELSPTERRVYDHISEGITAQKLADETGISLRRTYKYLRKLRGKKLVFRRKRPKIYSLAKEGSQVAEFLDKIQTLLAQFDKCNQNLQQNPYV